ncbi:MAG: nucleoside 2-deoxyribosyltransferase, partial [Alphaproteobacteria bacterium]
MMSKSVYLGGAFAQFTAAEVVAKQAEVEALLPEGVQCFKPQHREGYNPSLGEENIGSILTTRDYEMIKRSDVLILDVLGAQKASAGSFIEIGWASEMKKPIVLIAEEGNVHRHIMAMNLITACVISRRQAADVV